MITEDINLTNALTEESTQRAYHFKSQVIRNVLFGASALVLAVGVSAAAMVQ